MIDPKKCFDVLKDNEVEFFTGVPDSSLKSFTSYVTDNSNKFNNVIAANEGTSVALAMGHHLATGKVPFVYMQNSGIGNAVNPLLSLADEEVYKIPMLLMIGWRGEPGVKDEPQHVKQGEITVALLETMKIPYVVLSESEPNALKQLEEIIKKTKKASTPHVILAKRTLFSPYKLQSKLVNSFAMSREEALKLVVSHFQEDDIVVSTTGKLSRELFEFRVNSNQSHKSDFLTVGGMGHCSSIALGIAISKPDKRIYCLDGDGAVLMHTGAMSNIGDLAPKNYFHIIFNNGAHESVGGQPTVGFDVDFLKVAQAFSYKDYRSVETKEELSKTIAQLQEIDGPVLLEIKVRIDSRKDLGRPTISPVDNKANFMSNLRR